MKGVPLFINPWIYDFAAHDLWAKPLGLLTIASAVRRAGYTVRLIDCMDRHHPSLSYGKELKIKKGLFGTGKFLRTEVPKPPPLAHIKRRYSRYGISVEAFFRDLSAVDSPPAIIVTSLMTYWYQGVVEAIRAARKVHPNAPVILGGIYARLCPEHAKKTSGADIVFEGTGEIPFLIDFLKKTGASPGIGPSDAQCHPYPAFDLLHGLDYLCILTSRGCPYKCSYCASRILHAGFTRREPWQVLSEIRYWHENHGIRDFAFYDDALLAGPNKPIKELLNGIIGLDQGLRLHTPNAIHAKEINGETARLLHRAGFKTIRLGLETADFNIHRRLDNKIREGDFERAVDALLNAGFSASALGAYILAGLPGQEPEDVNNSLSLVERSGIVPFIAEYSPIPGTALWPEAVRDSEYEIEAEPLYHNNTLIPCWSEKKRQILTDIKKRALLLKNKAKGSIRKESP